MFFPILKRQLCLLPISRTINFQTTHLPWREIIIFIFIRCFIKLGTMMCSFADLHSVTYICLPAYQPKTSWNPSNIISRVYMIEFLTVWTSFSVMVHKHFVEHVSSVVSQISCLSLNSSICAIFLNLQVLVFIKD